MNGHNMTFDPPKWGNQRLNINQSAKLFAQSQLLQLIDFLEVLTLASYTSAETLAEGYAKNSAHLNNPLINIQTPDLASGHTLGSPIISGWLPNPLKYSQAAYLQSAYNLSAENIGMQNPISDNRTLPSSSGIAQDLCVNISYSQNLQGSNTDSQNLYTSLRGVQTLRVSFSDAQKEKDSTANATLWRKADLLYVINQLVNLDYCSDDALALRFSDLSFRSQASITHAEKLALELEGLLVSTLSFISSISSWGKRIPLYPDLLFLCPVAIRLISKKCFNTYKDTPLNKIPKVFKQIPLDVFKHYDVMYLNTFIGVRVKITTPRSAANTIEASNHNIIGANAMAIQQHNQTRLKFTFLIASGTQRLVDIHPVRLITVLADSEGEGRHDHTDIRFSSGGEPCLTPRPMTITPIRTGKPFRCCRWPLIA
ncbi:hypothetical protein [Xenorhabdus bovienii]|uniref:hypothetical protein n=1 Tax=Xenorhabdus bovienii TaxID=40576 RepID=UPI003F7F61A6